jgi:hypothetical protein
MSFYINMTYKTYGLHSNPTPRNFAITAFNSENNPSRYINKEINTYRSTFRLIFRHANQPPRCHLIFCRTLGLVSVAAFAGLENIVGWLHHYLKPGYCF